MVRPRHKRNQSSRSRRSSGGRTPDQTYWRAYALADKGQRRQAQCLYQDLLLSASEPRLKALVTNDLGALAALDGDVASARERFEAALILDEECSSAHSNPALLDEDVGRGAGLEPASPRGRLQTCSTTSNDESNFQPEQSDPVRVALVSFLFGPRALQRKARPSTTSR